MPFKKIRNKFISESGKKYTLKQVKFYYLTKGFKDFSKVKKKKYLNK